MIPNDPVMLLSYINTQLRDYYSDLADLCASLDLNQEELTQKLADIAYYYSTEKNQFV